MSEIKNLFTSFCNVVFPLGRPKKTFDSWDKGNCGAALNDELVRRLNAVRPTELQKRFADYEYYTFVHFGMNTCTGNEWGTGKEKPEQFDIADVDTDQWARVIKKSGSRGVIFTAKHHDGFCLFPSAYTGHCIKNSPYKNGKGDIVKELSESCKKFGLLFGVYLSRGTGTKAPTAQRAMTITLSISSPSFAQITAISSPSGLTAPRVRTRRTLHMTLSVIIKLSVRFSRVPPSATAVLTCAGLETRPAGCVKASGALLQKTPFPLRRL